MVVPGEERKEEEEEDKGQRGIVEKLAELEKQVLIVEKEIDLFKKSDRRHARENGDRVPASKPSNRFDALQEEDDEEDEAVWKAPREAEEKLQEELSEAIATASREARKLRRDRESLVARRIEVVRREEQMLQDFNKLELELESFRDSCAQLVSAADTRRREIEIFTRLASALARVDLDTASLEEIESYLRYAGISLASNSVDHVTAISPTTD